MSAWKVDHEQWEDWVLRDVVRNGIDEGFDAIDAELRERLQTLRLPTDVEETVVDAAPPSGADEEAQTVVRAAPAASEAADVGDPDPGMSGARTLVREAPKAPPADGLSVELRAPDGRELEVTLVTPAPPAVAEAELGDAVPVPAKPTVTEPRPTVPVAPPDEEEIEDDEGEMFIPALIRPASAAEVAYDEDEADEPEAAAPPEAPAATPPPPPVDGGSPPEAQAATPPALPTDSVPPPPPADSVPPPPPGGFDEAFDRSPEMVGDAFDSARASGEIGVPDPVRAGTMQTGGELGSVAGSLGGSQEPEPVVPRSKIVVDPSASGTFEQVEDEEELDESDLVEEEPEELVATEVEDAGPPAPPPVATVAAPAPARTGATIVPTAPVDDVWVEAAFGEHYFALHPESRPQQAAREVDFILRGTGTPAGARVLDVGCGDGAHALAFAKRGLNVIAFDASAAQVARAQQMAQRAGAAVQVVEGDMREPPVEGQFELVVCLGSTLGFFDDEVNRACVQHMADRLVPGGHLVLKVFNRDRMVGRLPARSWWQGRGCLVLDEASFDTRACRLVVHRTVVFEDGRQFDVTVDQRAYGAYELEGLCTAAGLTVAECSGSIHTRGTLYGAMSPDIWLVARRPT